MRGNRVPFVAFTDPPVSRDPRLGTWLDRLRSLDRYHAGKWAKYGPYGSVKAAHNAASRVRAHLDELLLSGEARADDGAYLYVIVHPEADDEGTP